MVLSSRAIVTMSLGALGLALVVVPSLAQQDPAVRRTNAAASPAPKKPSAPVAPLVASIDMDAVFKEYEKVKVSSDEFKTAAMARKNELMKLLQEAQQVAELMAKLNPGTADYKKHEDRVTELKAKHEAMREQAEREFASREAEAMATLYKEVQAMVAAVANWRGFNYVVKVSNQPISGSQPNSVMAAMANTVIYADTRNDITGDVVFNLNRRYRTSAGAAPKAAAQPAAGAAAPAGSAAPGGATAGPDGK